MLGASVVSELGCVTRQNGSWYEIEMNHENDCAKLVHIRVYMCNVALKQWLVRLLHQKSIEYIYVSVCSAPLWSNDGCWLCIWHSACHRTQCMSYLNGARYARQVLIVMSCINNHVMYLHFAWHHPFKWQYIFTCMTVQYVRCISLAVEWWCNVSKYYLTVCMSCVNGARNASDIVHTIVHVIWLSACHRTQDMSCINGARYACHVLTVHVTYLT